MLGHSVRKNSEKERQKDIFCYLLPYKEVEDSQPKRPPPFLHHTKYSSTTLNYKQLQQGLISQLQVTCVFRINLVRTQQRVLFVKKK